MGKKIGWIDYLKFLACILVLIGHYYLAFYNLCMVRPKLSNISISFFENFPRPFFDGNFWVCTFCVLSGMLTSNKKIESGKNLLKECILRYFRFVIPLFISNFVIFILYVTIGFSNHNFAEIYNNGWLNSYFCEVSFIKVIKNSIVLGSELNGPLWMLRPLFFGNIVIILLNYIVSKKNNLIYKYVIIVITCFLLLVLSIYIPNCLYTMCTCSGMLVTQFRKEKFGNIFFSICIALIISIYYIPNIREILTIHSLPLINILFSFIFVCSFYNWENSKKFELKNIPLGPISFWIYLFHWPIICSFASYFLMKFGNYTIGFWVLLFITGILVCMMAFVCVKYLDKIIGYINRKIGKLFDKILRI